MKRTEMKSAARRHFGPPISPSSYEIRPAVSGRLISLLRHRREFLLDFTVDFAFNFIAKFIFLAVTLISVQAVLTSVSAATVEQARLLPDPLLEE